MSLPEKLKFFCAPAAAGEAHSLLWANGYDCVTGAGRRAEAVFAWRGTATFVIAGLDPAIHRLN
jgi:hypothetical protein